MLRIGIVGYGNLGKGVECALGQSPDMGLAAVFSRRDPEKLTIQTPGVPVCRLWDLPQWKEKLDVLILCGGSATDLPVLTPQLAQDFCVVDSYDHHQKIADHFARVEDAAKMGGTVAVISAGWDPGLFSLHRLYARAVLPQGKDYTFWGRGVSQGHSDAARRIDGVQDARQYTVPISAARQAVRRGKCPDFSPGQMHRRVCYVVKKPGADAGHIRRQIKQMPGYFAPYATAVRFISQRQMARRHSAFPHGGTVLYTGRTGKTHQHRHTLELTLKLDSNPEFTAGVLLGCARAAHRLFRQGSAGCYTLLDIPPAYLSPMEKAQLLRQLL